jgi:hypothetical protein
METKAAECEGEASAVAERKANVKAEAKQLMREYLEGSTIHGLRKKALFKHTSSTLCTVELNAHKICYCLEQMFYNM